MTSKLAAKLIDVHGQDNLLFELNKFHFDDGSLRGTGRGTWMLAILMAWCLLARPDAPPLEVLKTPYTCFCCRSTPP